MSKCPTLAYRVCKSARVLPLANPAGRPRAADWAVRDRLEIHTPAEIRPNPQKIGVVGGGPRKIPKKSFCRLSYFSFNLVLHY